jgi:hypothetical protein
VRTKAAVGLVLVVGLLGAGAPAALSAVAGGYRGKTSQGTNVTFKLARGAVRNLKIVIRDKCPDGHILRVSAHYPPMTVEHGRFGGSFVPVGGHAGERAKLTGKVGRRAITGTLNDTSYSNREGALCHGRTGFRARRR